MRSGAVRAGPGLGTVGSMRSWAAVLGLAVALTACSGDDPPAASSSVTSSTSEASPTSVASSTLASSTTVTSPPDATPTSVSSSTTTVAGPAPSPPTPGVTATTTGSDPPGSPSSAGAPARIEEVELGRSVEGRPITAIHRGAPAGTVVLVVGDIHGDEAAGIAVVEALETADLPDGVDLWLVPAMNPDGVARQQRQNAHRVDLNRNFPSSWAPLGDPGDWEYAGPSAASEPETRAMVDLIDDVRPELALWYHQDLDRISPGTGRAGAVRARYAELTALPLAGISGGTYTGTAGPHVQHVVPGSVSVTVELGPGSLSPDAVEVHARAVLTLATELHMI